MDTLPPHANNGNPSPLPAASGIYKITCTANEKIYIGSAVNLRIRKEKHFNMLRGNKHHNPHLQNAWNKYGERAFTFEVLELVLPISLTAREQYWFKKINPFGLKGFNIAHEAGSNLGVKHTLEFSEKNRQAKLGRTLSPEHREKIRQSKLGNKNGRGKRSPETIAKMRQAHRGKTNAALMKTYIITAPDGTEYVVHGINQFCREHGLYSGSLVAVARGKHAHHHGWTARYPETEVKK